MTRRVLFVEVPGFYATVEVCQDPDLAGRPVIVGGDPRKRGLVQAASSEALAEGVEPEMPMVEALRLCPRARALRTNMRLYREMSRRLFAALRSGDDQVEPFGLGAAYLDLSGGSEAPEAIAARLRDRVAADLGLPLRAGIAAGKFAARVAAEESGASGVREVPVGAQAEFLSPLPATRLEGVGRKTAARLAELGARSIGQVAALGRERLEEALGTHGARIHALAAGDDDAPVRAARHPQSLSREVTLRSSSGGEAVDRGVLAEHLQDLVQDLQGELRLQGLSAGRVALKVRYADQATHTRSQVLQGPTLDGTEILAAALRLLDRTQAGSRPVRGLGIQLAKLARAAEADRQLDLFSPGR